MLERLSALLPSHTRRSEESDRFQQFSTPLGLGYLMTLAANLSPRKLVLEPSAGTGLLAVHAETQGATLMLNELAETRHAMLTALFPDAPVTQFNAEQIDDYLGSALRPAAVLMNPPFSASPHIDRAASDAAARHIRSALRRLADGGRLVALTSAKYDPAEDLSDDVSIMFTVTVDGAIYARHGTTVDTRLTVIDRVPGLNITAAGSASHAKTLVELLALIETHLPPPSSPAASMAVCAPPGKAASPVQAVSRAEAPALRPAARELPEDAEEVSFALREAISSETSFSDRIYEPYEVQSIAITGAKPHPTRLVQSAAMASVRAPLPSHRPLLPKGLIADNILSDAQIETIIYAGDAHTEMLAGRYKVDESLDNVALTKDNDADAVQFRKGFFLGDGTGSGKGRQAAGIILDNWLRGWRCHPPSIVSPI